MWSHCNISFSEEDSHIIKSLWQNEQCGAKRFLKEFPQKGWTLNGLKTWIIRKADRTGAAQCIPGSGHSWTVRTQDDINNIEELVLSQDTLPQTHLTQRQIAREVGISLTSVNRIVKKDLRLTCLKKRRPHELTEANKQIRLERCRRLLRLYPASLVNFMWFTDKNSRCA